MPKTRTSTVEDSYSSETLVVTQPNSFGVTSNHELLTPIQGAPPVNISKGRRRNPVTTSIYNHLISNRNIWFHVNLTFSEKKQVNSFTASLRNRAIKDGLKISAAAMYNESTKTYDVWIILY
jgi:hypothetical protein